MTDYLRPEDNAFEKLDHPDRGWSLFVPARGVQTNVLLKPGETASTFQHLGPISEINISTCGQQFRREVANIQHPHLGRSKTTSVGSLTPRVLGPSAVTGLALGARVAPPSCCVKLPPSLGCLPCTMPRDA